MIHIQHIKLGALSMFLVLATVMLTTIDLGQSSVLGQNTTSTLDSTPIAPSPEISSGDDDTSSIGNYVQETISDTIQESTNDNTQESTNDNTQKDESSSEEDIDETEDAKTNPLSVQINERVAGQLNATGIAVP